MKTITTSLLLLLLCISCAQTENQKQEKPTATEQSSLKKKPSIASQIAQLKANGYQIFDYVDEKTGDTVIMQQYFMAFLKSGPNRNQSEEEAAKLQEAHMAHLGRMYEEGYADISGPFGDDGELRGITVYNVPTLKMADSLANLDPMMKAGRLIVEIKPWWAGKGYPLR